MKAARLTAALAFSAFVTSGAFYVLAPPRTTTQFFDSSWPSIAWGFVFAIGGAIAAAGILRRVVHVERLGLALIIIAGSILTLTQGSVMIWGGEEGITWSRGGGVWAYAAFTLIAAALWLRLGKQVETVNLVADIERERGEDGR